MYATSVVYATRWIYTGMHEQCNMYALCTGAGGNIIVLLRHHENSVFDSTSYIYDGSSWRTTNHPGACGVQDSTVSTDRHIIFLSACEPEALFLDLTLFSASEGPSWIVQSFSHSSSPSRIVAVLHDKLLFAGKGETFSQDFVDDPYYNGLLENAIVQKVQCGWDGLGKDPLYEMTGFYPYPNQLPSARCCPTLDYFLNQPAGELFIRLSFKTSKICIIIRCGGAVGTYELPPGFVTADIEISSLANPAHSVSRTVALPAYIPEVICLVPICFCAGRMTVDVFASLLGLANLVTIVVARILWHLVLQES